MPADTLTAPQFRLALQSQPTLSVIVPARNAAGSLAQCLSALHAQTIPPDRFEVIVADDGSTDMTAAIAEQWGARVLRLRPEGPAAARNAGARAARGEILAFTDADCRPAPDWLVHLAAAFDATDVAGAKGAYRTDEKNLIARFVQQEYQDKYNGLARRSRIDFVDTYSAAYRRNVFLENGGFEAAFPAPSVEDQEFSFRLARKGYHLRFVPEAVVYHRHDLSLGEYLRRKFGIGYWKAYLLRWHPDKVWGDTHTPRAQQIQVGLLPLLLLTMLLAIEWRGLWWGAALEWLAFFASALPFSGKLARRDPALLLITPLMLVGRAAALGAGLAAGFWGLRRKAAPRQPAIPWPAAVLKRLLDVILSAIGLALAWPLIGLAALAVRLDSPGPAFFVQERIGEHGKPFRMFKLRTMVMGAEAQLARAAAASPLPGPAVKLPRDPRVTRVGRFLRRWSIDELPQLWNVLRGEMSLVGPRPEEPRVVAEYSDWHRRRLALRPGLTGPMQVNGRGDLPLDERVRLELDYLEHYSLGRDIQILLRSVPAVIGGRGAY